MLGKLEKVGIAVLAVFIGLAVISFVLPTIDPMYIPLYGTDPEVIGFSQPSAQHILGTDFMGRDLFSQLCSGAYFALIHGALWSIPAMVVLIIVAFILAQLREETPRLEDTALTRYARFVAFPLGVVGIILVLTLLFGAALGRVSWAFGIFIFAPLVGFMAWLAVGHDIEAKFRKGEKIPARLLLSGVVLIISYTALSNAVLTFFGMGDPSVVTWGMMLQWCFTSGYTFRAPFWLLPPIICVYVFSRGMLALSYGMYNTVSEKYFFKQGWF